MRKRLGILLLAALLCMGLGGCRLMRHTRLEVREYIGKSVKVAWFPEIESDKLISWDGTWKWRCRYTDTPDVVFYVSDDWLTGDYIIYGFTLSDDAETVFWQYYLNQYVSEGVGSLDAWEIRETYGHSDLELNFHSMEQVYPAAEQLQEFFDWYVEQPHSGRGRSARCYLADVPLPIWTLDDWDYFRNDTGDSTYDAMVNRCAEILKGYFAFYGLPCPGYTPEEIQTCALEIWPWDGGYSCPDRVWLDENPIAPNTFAGIGTKSRYISYAGFYEMLSRLDYEVDGTPEHFSFTGPDGCLYEFSYDFCEEADGETRWYFTCDGERLTSGSLSYSDGAPLLYLKDERFQDMAGLRFEYD